MTKRKSGPKLGKWWAFSKRRLLHLPQESVTMEVDFCPLPDIVDDEYGFWLGLVANHEDGSMLMHAIDRQPPSLNEMANLLASAMDCPHRGVRCRPEMVIVRDNPEWQAMVPYLDELGIKTIVTEELMHWDARADELMDWLQDHWATWPKASICQDKLPVPKALYDLRQMAHCFVIIQRPIPGKR